MTNLETNQNQTNIKINEAPIELTRNQGDVDAARHVDALPQADFDAFGPGFKQVGFSQETQDKIQAHQNTDPNTTNATTDTEKISNAKRIGQVVKMGAVSVMHSVERVANGHKIMSDPENQARIERERVRAGFTPRR